MNCDGACGKHTGEIRRVKIVRARGDDSNAFIGSEFNYCQTAREEDARRGFFLETIPEETEAQ